MTQMTHISIYGPGNNARTVLEILAKLACFQPDETAADINAVRQKQENPYAPLLTQTLGLLQDLGETREPPAYTGTRFELKDVSAEVETLSAKVAERGKRKAEIEAQLSTFEQTKAQLYHLTSLNASMDEIFACKYLKVRFGRLPKDSFVKLPYYADKSFTFREYDFDGEYYWGMYFVPEESAAEVDAIFKALYFERVWMPDFVHGTPQDALAQLLEDEAKDKAELAELTGAAQLAGPAEIERLLASAAWLNYESQIFEMYKYVIQLEHSYYISGFVPSESLPVLRSALKGLDGVEATEEPLEGTDAAAVHPPVKLKNNFFARPFEMFVEMYGLPSYGDLDPTPFVALTYSILFGAMFGDVGQGIVLGLVGYFIMYKKFKLGIGLVLTRCSVFSTLFGFIYGSVFGFEHVLDPMFHALGFEEKPIEALTPDGIITLLLASVAAGALLIIVAMCTGVYSCVRRGETARAVFSANGVAGIVFYFSLLMLLLKFAAGMAIPFVGTPLFYVLCLALPFVCIYFSEPLTKKFSGEENHETVGEMLMNGFFEMFDALLSFASNTMSFLRVGGFTLAHAGMMTMVFTLAEMTPNVFFYALVVIIGNAAVMGLEGLFVAIQVLRLEFYEMFSRFFEADGEPFSPLRIRSIGQA